MPPALSLGRLGTAYLSGLALCLAIDLFWVASRATKLRRRALGVIVFDRPNLPSAGMFYLIYAAGLLFFAEAPGLALGSWAATAAAGAVYGACACIAFALTSLRLHEAVNWRDIAWGAGFAATAAVVSYWIAA